MPERHNADLFKVLISQVTKVKSISFSAKRSAYSDMPSASSQSAICCIATPPDGFTALLDEGDKRVYPKFPESALLD